MLPLNDEGEGTVRLVKGETDEKSPGKRDVPSGTALVSNTTPCDGRTPHCGRVFQH
jgi:hypothetical protein